MTGLVDGDFSKKLASVKFTPNASGHWACWVSQATYAPRGWLDEIQVNDLGMPSASDVADAILDRASAIDGETFRNVMKFIAAAVLGTGDVSVAHPYRAIDDSSDRVKATFDGAGVRLTVTKTP